MLCRGPDVVRVIADEWRTFVSANTDSSWDESIFENGVVLGGHWKTKCRQGWAVEIQHLQLITKHQTERK